MITERKTLLSHLLAICTLLCMAAKLFAGFSTVQGEILNLQHQLSGDQKLADGGWAACAECDGHIEPVGAHDDSLGLGHHHHSSDGPSAPLMLQNNLPPVTLAQVIILRPGFASPLAGLPPGTLDQPPRV